jgi:L-amino acid N-acyltransferase YncA
MMAFLTHHGLGYCITLDDEIVSEAYAGPAVRGVMEIGIYTHPTCRRHGYAEIVCAQLITTCEAQGYRTFWNCGATNVASATLARKLGFHGEQEYALAAWFKTPAQEQAPTGA